MNSQATPTDEHLRLLSVFHYAWAGCGIFGLAFIALHYSFMSAIMDPARMAESGKPPPPEMMQMMQLMYVGFALYGITTMVLNVLAAMSIRARSNWTFCMIVAGINCISVPLGTVLGVFTLVLLGKDAAREKFR